jgi:GNAT superfamily N-acetyltransferase
MLARFPTVSSLAEVDGLRQRYLDGLIASQDALLEILVRDGQVHHVVVDDEVIGYAVVTDGALVEYFVVPEREYHAYLALPQLAAQHGVRKALVKTFDHVFLMSTLFNRPSGQVSVRGVLVRDYVRRELPRSPELEYTQRTATPDDLPAIQAIDQPVFTHPERLRFVVGQGFVELFERPAGGPLIGFGLMRPVVEGRPHVEVGVAVDPAFRNQRYAMHMMRDMFDHCVARGLTPISGCARDNEVSIRMGTRIGLVSRYLLVEVEL